MTAAQWREGINSLFGGYLSAKAKFAIKVSLSLTLAYIIPMAFGWSQPSTAAITVMLIVATGGMRESLMKGTYRVIGTIIGMIVGVGLIVLLSSHTGIYFFSVSVVIATIFYIYRCCQGDNTVFMLTGVMVMMSYNGGDFDGSLLYGIERAFMTIFGIVIYTLVGSFIWPAKATVDIRQTVTELSADYCQLFSTLRQPALAEQAKQELAAVVIKTESLQQQYIVMQSDAGESGAYRKHWQMIVQHYHDLSARLTNAMQLSHQQQTNIDEYVGGYQGLLDMMASQLSAINASWQGGEQHITAAITLQGDEQRLQSLGHLDAAQLIGRGDWMQSFSQLLLSLNQVVVALNTDSDDFEYRPNSKPASFIWLDRESFKLGAMAFITFWFAHALWFFYNPPGGYSFVTFATMFVPLVGFTPVKPKLLYILFTFAFLFAGFAYVFILPNLSHWIELFIFIFIYAFAGFYLLQGPVAIFFLLGLFVLGIDNQMQYNFAVILTVMLMFYLAITVLLITVYFPFNSKPEYLYRNMRRRFFSAVTTVLAYQGQSLSFVQRQHLGYAAFACVRLCGQMKSWGGLIDYGYFSGIDKAGIDQLNESVSVLSGRIQLLMERRQSFNKNPLIELVRQAQKEGFLVDFSTQLMTSEGSAIVADSNQIWQNYEQKITLLLASIDMSQYSKQQIAEFYLGINLYKNIMGSLIQCDQRMADIDWSALKQSRF
ncbi:hypothetical protein SIN8267_02750 [Sinobacterium norvegicum]|uniref:FUSC family protein n=1 Tax=Sinobacterium norvegicum TaxID=1641715 RepID=A0ABM9AHB7_9GAMM|nr:FUSC family protein [Sinobacterium norvegicum]CAH0992617.1 hypothetical protein SIN8267_02750 [Sinobacterium norvegicum]